MLISVNESLGGAEPVHSLRFSECGILERQHLQEWICQVPEILGEEILVLSAEFDRFDRASDRLDILALDRDGNLVVIELKRSPHAEYADLQAIRYAAMVSTMTIEQVVPYYQKHVQRSGDGEISREEAEERIREFVTKSDFESFSSSPRIVLASEDFSPALTTTVLWLNSQGLDVSCVRLKPYRISDKIVIVPQAIIPIPEAEEYLVRVREKEEERTAASSGRNPTAVSVVIDNDLIPRGAPLLLKANLPSYIEFDPDNDMFQAEFTGESGQSNAVVWVHDGQEYSMSNLAWRVFSRFHPKGSPGGVNGSVHWETEAGQTVKELAEQFLANESHES